MHRINLIQSLGTGVKYPVLFLLFYLPIQLEAQVTVHGRVFGAGGKFLPDISVVAEKSGNGTATDSLGFFHLTITDTIRKQILLFSAIGYGSVSRSIDLDTALQNPVMVELFQDVLNLDEVVVTGMVVETSRKKLGNSISTITAKQTEYTGSSHLSGILDGKIMGGIIMQNSGDPAGGFSLKLRGVSSIYGSSEPLYMLDGVIIDNRSNNIVNLYQKQVTPNHHYETGTNRLVDINPHDIDHIEIINGPAAAAIYGSRAANGVVQIFSKKGTKGKPTITFTTAVNHNSLLKKLDVNQTPYRFGVQKSERLTNFDESRTTIANRRTDAAPAYGPVGSNGKKLDTTRYPVNRYDYQDDIFQDSWGTDLHLAVSNGWDKGNIYMAASYLNNNGTVVGTNFQRYGLKLRADYNLNPFITLTGGLMYSNSQSAEKSNSALQFSTIASINHIDNVYDIHQRDNLGKLLAVENGWVNPISTLEGNDISTVTDRSIADLGIRATPWKGFAIAAKIGMDIYAQQGFTIHDRLPYYSNGNVGLNLFPDGYVSSSKLNYSQWTGDISVAYSAKFMEHFTSSTVAGYSGQYFKTIFQSQEGRDLLPFVRTINAAQNFFTAPVDDRAEQTVYGYYLQETIGYKDLAYLTLAGRFDGSSAFGSEAGKIFYPKASVAFNISELSFWKENNIHTWFNTFKLRAAYGKAGNLTGIGPYDRFNNYPPVNYYAGGIVPQNRQGNESIKPEVKTEWEAGTDLQFLQGRLFARFNIYQQKINDLVIIYNWAPSNGSSSILENIGDMENRGIELHLGATIIQKKDFSWEASILINRNKNEVTRSNASSFVGLDFQNTEGIIPGYPMGVFYGFYYARNADGTLLLKDNNGFLLPQVERGDPASSKPVRDANGQPIGSPVRKVLGDPNPDYAACLVNDFTYRKWRLHIQVDRVAGFEVFNWAGVIRNNIGHGKNPERELKGELPRGWSAAIGGFISGPIIHEEFVEDGSFVKLRELALSYQLTSLKRVKSMDFILTGRNLFTITNYSGYDPETNTAGQSILRGLDYSTNPIPRVIQFSIVTRF